MEIAAAHAWGLAMARTLAEHAEAPEHPLRMGYEEWLAWANDEVRSEGLRSEWVDGEVIVFDMPKVIHQRILFFVATLMSMHARRFNLGEVFVAGTEMWLASRPSARQPDIMFVAAAHLDRVTADRLDGPADLIVELISDDSVTRDRRDKLAEYEAAGVPEYLMIDPRPRQRRTAFYRLGADGLYLPVRPDETGRYRSAVLPGFALDPAWLWQDPLPDPEALLPPRWVSATGSGGP